ncbi:MAG TPA: gfo/Idh/MocA family oxidoreductase, partial [Candidatus Dormibacteraeota bacterium]|nr:gfo/Idh/MocA family oxidoreductase [Candidatus Dormibacteraeota bacterium]
ASVAVQWLYHDGRFAQIASTTRGQNPFAGLIAGTEGWISVNGRVSRPTSITIHDATGDEVLPDPLPGRGYGPEVAEVERCLRAGELESPLVPLDETVAILEVCDGVRAQLGVRYEADLE